MSTPSSEYLEELQEGLAAGRWWAIMEVEDPIDDYDIGDIVSGWRASGWGTVEAGGASSPSPLVFSEASEKAQSQDSDLSDAKLKTTEWRRQKTTGGPSFPGRSTQGAPGPVHSQRRRFNSSQVFSEASEKAQATDQRTNWRQRRPESPVSPQEPPMPTGSKQRGKLRIPQHLTKHLIKASSETPIPNKRTPVTAPKVLVPEKPLRPELMPEGEPEKKKRKKRRQTRPEEPPVSSVAPQEPPVSSVAPQEPPVPSVAPQEPAVPSVAPQEPAVSSVAPQEPAVSSVAPQEPAVPSVAPQEPPVPSVAPQEPAVSSVAPQEPPVSSVAPQEPPVPGRSQQREATRNFEHQAGDRPKSSSETPRPNKPLRAPVTTPDGLPYSPRGAPVPLAPSLKTEPVCGAPVDEKISGWVYLKDLRIPRVQWEKQCVPAQTPPRTPVPLKRRTQSLQPRTRPSRKRALVNAGVEQLPSLKRQRMAIKVQWDPDSREEMDHLCCLFSKLCVITNR